MFLFSYKGALMFLGLLQHYYCHVDAADSHSLEQSPCVRLFHRNGDVGCRTSDRFGGKFPLYGIEDETHLRELELHADEKLAVVMQEMMFNASTIQRLEATKKLGAVIVLKDSSLSGQISSSPSAKFSPDVSTPQGYGTPTQQFDLNADYGWNQHGNGMMMRSMNYPIVLVSNPKDMKVAHDYAVSNRNSGLKNYPRYVANMEFYFGPEGINSLDCLKWKDIDGTADPKCLPLGGQSVWGVAGVTGEKPLILLNTVLDSNGMFHDVIPGGNGVVSGLVALLVAAEALARAVEAGSIDLTSLPYQIGFAAFQAEAWGFTGSRAFVNDVTSEDFPCGNHVDAATSPTGLPMCLDPLYPSLEFRKLRSKGLAYVISVDQVGILDDSSSLYLHPSKGALDVDVAAFLLVNEPLQVKLTTALGVLPPTPLTSFYTADNQQKGFVLSGYDSTFSDALYHSHMDSHFGRCDLQGSSTAGLALARGAYILAGGSIAGAAKIVVNDTLVEILTACLTINWACPFMSPYVETELTNFEKYTGEAVSIAAQIPPTFYTSVLQYWGSGGLPVVKRTKKDGSWQQFASLSDGNMEEIDKLHESPSMLEAFVRTYLAEQLSIAAGEGFRGGDCESSADCDGAVCTAIGETSKRECVRGTCTCPLAHYHIALDPGLQRQTTPGFYDVVDESAPLWSEPNWKTIGVDLYREAGPGIGQMAFSLGLASTACAIFGSMVLRRGLLKAKLL